MRYTEATWEVQADIQDDTKIEEYYKRQKPPSPKRWKKKERPPASAWEEYPESPEYKGGNKLRPYQLEGLNWLSFCWYNNRNSILADEMGLGKTVQTVSMLNHLFTKENMHGPFLIVAPLITVPHWQREFEGWTDMNAVIYHGTASSRELIRKYEWDYDSLKGSPPPFKFNVLITTFEMVLTDVNILSKIGWRYVAVDEAHRLKNTKSKLINALREFDFDHMLLLTGTPLQNNTEELWTLLNFIDTERFGSADAFAERFGDLKDNTQVEELHEILRPYLLRRMKEDVEKGIAPKEETIVEVELTTIQKSYYRAIFERNFDSLNMGAKASNIPSLLNIMMQLRKCCNHPYLLRGVEDNIARQRAGSDVDENELLIHSCGKLVLVDKLLARLKEGGHKVLIFSQMIRLLDILEDYLIHKGYAYERIDGSKRGNERQQAIDRFSAPDSDRFVFLLCTRAGGLGINLTAADTCIIYDSDWNPQNDIQAMARCHRIGQTQRVKIYRLITRNTYEKAMFHKASLKLGLDQVVLTRMKSSATGASSAVATTSVDSNMTTNAALRAMDKKEIEQLLRYGAYNTFSEENENEKFDEQDIDQILERNSTTIVHDNPSAEANALSSFSKASFISSSGDANADLDVSDPDFWKKLLPGKFAQKQSAEDSVMADSLTPRARPSAQRYSLRDTSDRFPVFDPYLSSDGEGEAFGDDAEDENFDYGSGLSWTSRERSKLKGLLSHYGYGQWKAIQEVGELDRWTLRQIKAYTDAMIMNCATQIGEDPHSLIEFLQSNSIETDREREAEEEAAKSMAPGESEVTDFSFDPSLADSNFSLYKPGNANLFIRKLENIAKVSKAVSDCVGEMGRKFAPPSVSGEPPSPSWTAEDDRSLVLGTSYHGYGQYEKMRTDPRLTFSRFELSSSVASTETDKMDTEDGETKESTDDKEATAAVTGKEIWPQEKVLHRQLRKILRLLTHDEDSYVPDVRNEEVYEADGGSDEEHEPEPEEPEGRRGRKRYFSNHEWSKREKQAVYRNSVAFGMPEEDDIPGWADFKQAASLTRKNIEQIQLFCRALMDTAEAASDKEKKKPSKDWSTEVDGDLKLTKAQSKRLVQRVHVFRDLRRSVLPRLEQLPTLLASAARTYMPKWWVASRHDHPLICGILKHGFGQWEKLCADPELPFYDMAKEKMASSKSSTTTGTTEESETPAEEEPSQEPTALNKSTGGASDDEDDDDDDKSRRRGRKADVYTTAINFPKEKPIIKRVAYIIKYLTELKLSPLSDESKVSFSRSSNLKSTALPPPGESPNLNVSTSSLTLDSDPIPGRRQNVCAGRKPSTKKYTEIPRQEDGSPIFPIIFGKMRIESLGKVVPNDPNYHNDRYIWTVGYRSIRPYQSFVDPNTRTEYTSEILDGGDRPLFQVTASDAPDRPGQGNSPTAAWTAILRKINEKTNKPFNAVSGPEYFGLAKGIISKVCYSTLIHPTISLFPCLLFFCMRS